MKTLLFIGGIGMQEVLLIALVILLFFGGKKIPELSSGYVMFMIGVAVSYLLIFPLIFRFLGTYQVSVDVVANMVTLQSYMSTLMMMSLTMGLVFELPVVIWLLSRMGIVSSGFLRKYRRHAVVIILVIAAVITPTSDIFTLLLVSLPMYMLYEISILISKQKK